MGTAVPATKVTQEEALQIARLISDDYPELCESLDRIYPKTCIRERYVIQHPALVKSLLADGTAASRVKDRLQANGGPSTTERLKAIDEAAGPMAESASRRALADAGMDAARVTHLVTASSTSSSAPGLDTVLVERLGLSPSVHRTNIGMMMCHAALNGLRVASAFALSDPSAVVLLCALEVCSAHYDLQPLPKKLVTNAIFADGAAAVVGTGGPAGAWEIDSCGGVLLNSERDGLKVAFGEQGLDIQLSTRVPALIERNLRPWVANWLQSQGLSIGDVKSWAVHPGGPKVLQAAAGALGLDDRALEDSWNVLADHGNMSSPTILFILERLRRQQCALPCVAIAFGPGLAIECSLIGRSAHSQLTVSAA